VCGKTEGLLLLAKFTTIYKILYLKGNYVQFGKAKQRKMKKKKQKRKRRRDLGSAGQTEARKRAKFKFRIPELRIFARL